MKVLSCRNKILFPIQAILDSSFNIFIEVNELERGDYYRYRISMILPNPQLWVVASIRRH